MSVIAVLALLFTVVNPLTQGRNIGSEYINFPFPIPELGNQNDNIDNTAKNNNGINILNNISGILDSVRSGIVNGTDKAIDVLSIPQQTLYHLIRQATLFLEKLGFRLINSTVGEVDSVDRVKRMISRSQNCLVQSSVDLPNVVTKSVAHCFTDAIQKPVKIVQDIVDEINLALSLLRNLLGCAKACDGIGCIVIKCASASSPSIKLLFNVIKTVYNSLTFLFTSFAEVPVCFTGALSIQPVAKLLKVGWDFTRCII